MGVMGGVSSTFSVDSVNGMFSVFSVARKICISNVNQSFFARFIEFDIIQMFIIMSGV